MVWLQDNLLALYGALVGTIALLLNFGRYWILYKKSSRKLKVSSAIDSRAQIALNSLAKPSSGFTGRREPLCGPIYTIDVINVSHVQMHIQDVGLVVKSNDGRRKLKAVASAGRGSSFSSVDEIGGDNIPAGAMKSYSIWLSSEPEIPIVLGCYVIDQLGKEYRGKHFATSPQLTVPELHMEPDAASKTSSSSV